MQAKFEKQALALQYPWSFSVLVVRHFLIFSAVLSFISVHVLCVKPLIPSRRYPSLTVVRSHN
ncbi:hypothetical protein EMIT0P74_130138 [Pseudomonas sp. IT-P74]